MTVHDEARKLLEREAASRARPGEERGRYEIWQHDDLGGDKQFPEHYRRHATVEAAGLEHALMINRLDDFDDGSTGKCRFTQDGDVIVDPRGSAHRIGGDAREPSFKEIELDTPTPTAARALFAEWRDDHAAAKERDTHGERFAEVSTPQPDAGPLDRARQAAKERAPRQPSRGKDREPDIG